MALRIGDYLQRAEIDNRVRGEVEGYVLLRGCEQPILLKLAGNCWRDMAGRRFVFEGTGGAGCPADKMPAPGQEGATGDMTASRMVRVFTIPLEEALARIRRGEAPPEKTANGLYLEWYSDSNGRVVLNSLGYRSSPDPGSVVACLKRALGCFDPAIKAVNQVQEKNLIPASELAGYTRELFEIREAALDLMRRFRTR